MSADFEVVDHSVYDGRVYLGRYVQSAPKFFEAFDTEDTSLGSFGKQKDACAAITESHPKGYEHGR